MRNHPPGMETGAIQIKTACFWILHEGQNKEESEMISSFSMFPKCLSIDFNFDVKYISSNEGCNTSYVRPFSTKIVPLLYLWYLELSISWWLVLSTFDRYLPNFLYWFRKTWNKADLNYWQRLNCSDI